MKEELKKEYEKLSDLELDYNIISKFTDDKIEKAVALSKLKKQLEKIRRIEGEVVKTASNKEKDKDV